MALGRVLDASCRGQNKKEKKRKERNKKKKKKKKKKKAMTWNDETDLCGICMEPLPRWGNEFKTLTCCGKGMHKKCAEKYMASSYTRAQGHPCPMCRTPLPKTGLESHLHALKWAEKGKGWAMHIVADDYRYGNGVAQSLKTARLWFGKAAEQGLVESQFALALMHMFGSLPELCEGEPVSMKQARVWLGRAADQGHAEAQYSLGLMHQSGQGGPVSMEKARVWFERAAEQGYAEAQYALNDISGYFKDD